MGIHRVDCLAMARAAKAFALLAGATSVYAQVQQVVGVSHAFGKFIQDFRKVYEEAEKEARFAAFAANYAYIQLENAKGHSYELGINQFADMTPDEFAMSRFGLHPRETKRWGTLTSLGKHMRGNATLPASVDWREKGAVTQVKNQAQCGSCWAFSTTGALEGAWQIASGNLVSLSEQQLIDCSRKQGNEGCNGGMMDGGFKYEEGVDACTEESYPYKAKDGTCQASTCSVGVPKHAVVGYMDVDENDDEALMEAVAQQPVSVAIEADKMAFQLYKGGVLDAECGTALDHGVLAVGYGEEEGKKYWLVKNSWGPGWGEEGYIKILRGEEGKGMCGINMQPSYPVVQAAPGPSPGPAPPSPSPPAPAPSASHYEKPPCQEDEVQASIQSLSGEVCAAECDDAQACPSDTPTGTTALPMCLLQDASSGKQYCALVCFDDASCPNGAKCGLQGALGICVYPTDSNHAAANVMAIMEASERTREEATISI